MLVSGALYCVRMFVLRPAIKIQLLNTYVCALLRKSGGCAQAVSCVKMLVLRSPLRTAKSYMSLVEWLVD